MLRIFDTPIPVQKPKLVYLPVPWEVTTSYGKGTALGPQAVLNASQQVDLWDLDLGPIFAAGLELLPLDPDYPQWNALGRKKVQQLLTLSSKLPAVQKKNQLLKEINQLSFQLNHSIYQQTQRLRAAGQWVGLLGGDHSIAFGGIQALAEEFQEMGILQIDAHSDTRKAYQRMIHSHASIMYNVLTQCPQVSTLVQVGIRDLCEEEQLFTQNHPGVHTFFDRHLARAQFQGQNWDQLTTLILKPLPKKVWVSFDIDGLDPTLCPQTGTPVPGGLSFNQVIYLLDRLVASSRQIVGFDLSEIASPSTHPLKSSTAQIEWDANVGARLLYLLSGQLLRSHHQL